ncbi:MAG: PEFG-CTERM sorting domain-containing protein [Cenarchaeum symbiont of Oopsacas minuta]|nr:PEFG-CTERM sorting domain-containing protein [Cenarchaeum symbiont of Oopsacas minuta]
MLTVLVAMMVTGTAFGSAYAATSGISIMLESAEDKITYSGDTSSSIDITIQFIGIDGKKIIGADQITPDSDLKYTGDLLGINKLVDGSYTVKAFQSKSATASAKFTVASGMVVDIFDVQNTYTTSKSIQDKHTEPEVMMEEKGLILINASQVGTTMIMITGTTDKSDSISIVATSPNGNVVGIDQIPPSADGTFAINMAIGGNLGKQDGLYTITAQQGSNTQYKDEILIDIIDGVIVPEFGSAAIVVFVVAIVSIVAITSRSKLGIQQKL